MIPYHIDLSIQVIEVKREIYNFTFLFLFFTTSEYCMSTPSFPQTIYDHEHVVY